MDPCVALISPPTCDPTAPYLAVPALTGFLRQHGVTVLPLDANLEGWEALLRPAPLAALAGRLEQRLAALERRPALEHREQRAYATLWAARGDGAAAPGAIDGALALLRERDGERFFDPRAYGDAVATVEAAQRVVAAAHAPLELDFVSYRTPFGLLDARQVAAEASPARNPFHEGFVALAGRLAAAGVGLVGLSIAFPGQLQPAFALARVLAERLPGVSRVAGGPALTQLLLRLPPEERAGAVAELGLDAAVLFEGEWALYEAVQRLRRGEPAFPGRLVTGRPIDDLGALPPPDFDGLPLPRYLAPATVLPYDPSRGCPWGRCAFCHYGLAETGTARYRERPAAQVASHLAGLRQRHGAAVLYLSQDSFAPRLATQVADLLRGQASGVRWASDMRPERSLDAGRCTRLAAGGALALSLGIESGCPRVLAAIDKGVRPEHAAAAVRNLAAAGLAVEAMTFTHFPGERASEARQTVRWLEELREQLALFIVGRFALVAGARVAREPGRYGLAESWHVAGDRFRSALFYREQGRPWSEAEERRLDQAVERLAGSFRLSHYPWAGALSTAHSLLWYLHHGPAAFHRDPRARERAPHVPGARRRVCDSRFDVERVTRRSEEGEAAIWRELTQQQRRVSPAAYDALADRLPAARPAPGRWLVAAGAPPLRAPGRDGGRAPARSGKR